MVGEVAKKVDFWLGYGYFIETIHDGDGTYHLVIKTGDFNTRKEADSAVAFFRKTISERAKWRDA